MEVTLIAGLDHAWFTRDQLLCGGTSVWFHFFFFFILIPLFLKKKKNCNFCAIFVYFWFYFGVFVWGFHASFYFKGHGKYVLPKNGALLPRYGKSLMDQKTVWADGTALSMHIQPGVKKQQHPTHPSTVVPSV